MTERNRSLQMRTRVVLFMLVASILVPQAVWSQQFVLNSRPDDAAAAARQQQVTQAAESLRQKLIEQRRDFHMNPELSNREVRTSRVVAEKLKALGLTDIKTGIARHGVTALLVGAKPG